MGGHQSKNLIRIKIQGDNLTGTFIYDQNEEDTEPNFVKYLFYTHSDKRFKKVTRIDESQVMGFKGTTYSYDGNRELIRETLDNFDPNERELDSLLDILELECRLEKVPEKKLRAARAHPLASRVANSLELFSGICYFSLQ